MKKRNQIAQAAVLSVAALSSVTAMAETATVTSTVTVDNTIDFTATGTLNFGTIRALASNSATNCAGLVMSASSATPTVTVATTANNAYNTACAGGSTNAALQSIGGTLARPSFTIAGVPAFTTLNVTLPTSVDLVAPLAPGAAKFQLVGFTAFKTTAPTGAVTSTVQADGTGGATFVLGATLITDPATFAGQNYENDIAYTGDIDVTVAYP